MNWLNMARAGLMGLEFYTPETGKWRQAHMCARYVILRVMLEAGEGFVSIEQFTSADGKPDLVVRLDASKIETTGKKCIGDFLLKLQVYKSYGDVERGFYFFLGGQLLGARRRHTPEGQIASEGTVGKVSVRRVFGCLQVGTGPRRSPLACSRDIDKKRKKAPDSSRGRDQDVHRLLCCPQPDGGVPRCRPRAQAATADDGAVGDEGER